MYKITTHENGRQSIVTEQPNMDITIINDGETPKKIIKADKLPKSRLATVLITARKVDSEHKRGHNNTKEPESL